METIKTTPNLEFDVIYADGTRKRVQEGVLYEAEENGDIIFHNATDRPAVMLAATETALVALYGMGPGLLALAMGMAISEESRAVLTELSSCAGAILESRSAQDQAIFRLGQMDMQQSILDMIRSLASSASGIAHITLTTLAEMIEAIEVQP